MLEIERKILFLKTKHIWFSEFPFDIEGYDSVLFRACKNKVDAEGFNRTEFHTLVIDLTQDIDIIWKNMSKSSCRYAIKKAEKDGITVKLSQNFSEFSQIDSAFRKMKELPSNSKQLKIAKEYGTLFVSSWNNEILGGQIYLEDKNNIRWFIGASRRLEVDKLKASLIGNANRLLVWEAIKYAKNKGIKEFDLGGYYLQEEKDIQNDRINFFKKSFGGELVTHYIYQKNYSRTFKIADKLYHLKTGR